MFWNVRVITPFLMSFLGQTEFLIKERAFIFFCWCSKPVLKSLCINYYNSFFAASVHVSFSDWVPMLKDVDCFRKYFKLNNLVIPSSEGSRVKNESWVWGTNKGDGSLLNTPIVFLSTCFLCGRFAQFPLQHGTAI